MEKDKDGDRLERLFTAARKSQPYDARLEYGFETRVMAAIRERRGAQRTFSSWAWRLIPALTAVVIMLGVWTYISDHRPAFGFSLISGVSSEETQLVASLTGE